MSHVRESCLAIYTTIFGDHDFLREPSRDLAGACPFICFTDDPTLTSEHFQLRICRRQLADPVRESRMYKILPHVFLPEYRYTLWVDASTELHISDPAALVAEQLRDCGIAIMEHPANDDIYAELDRCLHFRKDDPGLMKRQVEAYRRDGYPAGGGLVSGCAILRDNLDPRVCELNEAWWSEVQRFSRRDQLSFNYVAWKRGIRYAILDRFRTLTPLPQSRYFTIHPHKKPSTYRQTVKVYLRWSRRNTPGMDGR